MSDILSRLLGAAAQDRDGDGIPDALQGMLGGGDRAMGGLEQITSQLRQAGLGRQVDSWVGNGQNEPVAPDMLQQAFGRQSMDRLGQRAGTDGAGLAGMLATMLPVLINAMTPNGRMPQNAAEMPRGGGLEALRGAVGGSGGDGAGGLLSGLDSFLGGGAPRQGFSGGGGQGGMGGSVERDGLEDGAAHGKFGPGQGGGRKG